MFLFLYSGLLCFVNISSQYLDIVLQDGVFHYKFLAAQKFMEGLYWCRASKPLRRHYVTVKGKSLMNYLTGLLMLHCWVTSVYYTLLF